MNFKIVAEEHSTSKKKKKSVHTFFNFVVEIHTIYTIIGITI